MNLQERLSPPRFQLVYNAPFAAAVYVGLASGGPFNFVQEVIAHNAFVAATPSGRYGELVDELTAVMRTLAPGELARLEADYADLDAPAMRRQALRIVDGAATVAASLAGGEGYRRWVLEAGRQIAFTRSGGLLGIGGEAAVDPAEQAALDELSRRLEAAGHD